MSDDLDPRFERDLRGVLAADAPADAPASLYAFVAEVAGRPPRRKGLPRTTVLLGLAAAASVVIAVTALTLALRPFDRLPSAGGPGQEVPLAGAYRLDLVYEVVPPDGGVTTDDQVQAVADAMRSRLMQSGWTEAIVTTAVADRVAVSVGLESDDEAVVGAIRDLLGSTGRLDVVPMGDAMPSEGDRIDLDANPPLFSNEGIASAQIGVDQTGRRTVDIAFTPDAAAAFAAWTTDNVGKFIAFVVDGVVLSAPMVAEPIQDGIVQIGGSGPEGWPIDEAQSLVSALTAGPLPLPVREVGMELGLASPVPERTPVPGLTPAEDACQEGSPDLLQTRVALVDGTHGAMILSAPAAGSPDLVRITLCRWIETPSGVMATDSTGGTLPAAAPDILSVDRATTTSDTVPEHLVGGRAAPAVASVTVTRTDGTVEEAEVVAGYWLAWWAGDAGSMLVTALDASGAVLSETPFASDSR